VKTAQRIALLSLVAILLAGAFPHRAVSATLAPRVLIPLVTYGRCAWVILEVTRLPPYGSDTDLEGRVPTCASPAHYNVAVYIYVSGWWTKPSFASRLTTIRPDGTWTTDITTGGTDETATQIAVFLVPSTYNPPLLSGAPTLPEELFTNARGEFVLVDRQP
jgi:hypothetical protein